MTGRVRVGNERRLAFVVLAAAFGIMPISVSALIGVGLMIALDCLSWRDAGNALSTQVIMIIVTSLALGKALMGTGLMLAASSRTCPYR